MNTQSSRPEMLLGEKASRIEARDGLENAYPEGYWIPSLMGSGLI